MATGVSKHELSRHHAKHGGKKKEEKHEMHHMEIEKHDNGGYTTHAHAHEKHEMCNDDCESAAHANHGKMVKHVKESFQEEGNTQEAAESLEPRQGRGEKEFD